MEQGNSDDGGGHGPGRPARDLVSKVLVELLVASLAAGIAWAVHELVTGASGTIWPWAAAALAFMVVAFVAYRVGRRGGGGPSGGGSPV